MWNLAGRESALSSSPNLLFLETRFWEHVLLKGSLRTSDGCSGSMGALSARPRREDPGIPESSLDSNLAAP